MKSQITMGLFSLLLAASPWTISLAKTQSDVQSAETSEAVEPQSALSSTSADVVKLANSGVEEGVLLDFVRNSLNPFQLTADDIIYLRDLGISSEVISAMLRHDETLPQQTKTADEIATPQTSEVNNPPAVTNVTEVASTSDVLVSYAEDAPAEVQPFYDSLSPYGTWINVEDQGWAWQPNAVVARSDWRPYCDNGRWVWSDAGWYWASDYSWGWAPFHYGRWWRSPQWNWVWFPGTTWAPSWVTWRTYNNFYGWAPLPPRAVFTDFGFRFNNAAVGFNFGFGLPSDCFTFVNSKQFFSHGFRGHRLHNAQVNQFFNNSTVVNNFAVNPHNKGIINRGIDVNRVEKFTGKKIHTVPVVDRPAHGGGFHQPRQIVKNGTTVGVVRTPLPNASHKERFVAQKADPQKAIVPSVPQRFANTRVKTAPPEAVQQTSRQEARIPTRKTWNSASQPGSTFNPPNRAKPVGQNQAPVAPLTSPRIETRNPSANKEIREPTGAPGMSKQNTENRMRSVPNQPRTTTSPETIAPPSTITPSKAKVAPSVNNAPRIEKPNPEGRARPNAPSKPSMTTPPKAVAPPPTIPPKLTPSIAPSKGATLRIAPSQTPPKTAPPSITRPPSPTQRAPAMTSLRATAPLQVSRPQNFNPAPQRINQPPQGGAPSMQRPIVSARPQQNFSIPQRYMGNSHGGNAAAIRAAPSSRQAAPMPQSNQSSGSRGGSGGHQGRR